jgi:hypothetical protein
MPVEGIVEEDLEDLEESKKSMTKSEKEKWIKRFERNMCPANYGNENGESE